MNENDKQLEHAVSNGRRWMEKIHEQVAAVRAAEEACDDDDIREQILESPLSIEVRSGWYCPGAEGKERAPEEYRILLSTGGPASQIVGALGIYGEPETARLEVQDWGTPWVELTLSDEDAVSLLAWVSVFWFGEGQ